MPKRKPTTIRVTATDIKNGVWNHIELCPIGRAATRAFPNVEGLSVECDAMYFGQAGHVELPARARAFIERFDYVPPYGELKPKKVKPFEFRILAPKEAP